MNARLLKQLTAHRDLHAPAAQMWLTRNSQPLLADASTSGLKPSPYVHIRFLASQFPTHKTSMHTEKQPLLV
jgi:hypothetical protein